MRLVRPACRAKGSLVGALYPPAAGDDTALWRTAVLKGENPWAQVLLAEALEKGEGGAANTDEALAFYRAAAAQDREPEAKKRAEAAIARLPSSGQR